MNTLRRLTSIERSSFTHGLSNNTCQPTKRHSGLKTAGLVCVLIAGLFSVFQPAPVVANDDQSQLDVALSLAKLLRAARTVIASNQPLINDPAKGDKGLSGDVVTEAILKKLEADPSIDRQMVEGDTQAGRLMRIQLEAFKEIVDENQTLINQEGIGFKGFVPAVFAQLSNERFGEKANNEAQIKVTAPRHLVRNRKTRPDKWENEVITDRFSSPDWPQGELYAETVSFKGKSTFRVIVPEYYGKACLACHGEPKEEVDITGYPKEGGKLGDLGGAISIMLLK